MLRGIAWVLGVLLVLGGCWWLYNRVTESAVPTNGEVFVRPSSADSNDQQTSQDKQAKSDIDSNTAKQQPATPPTQPATAQPVPTPQQAASAPTHPAAQPPAQQSTPATNPSAPLPVADTVAPNPPNGMVFAGSGKYQWYRQGNLTWRVNTQTGTSCIAFATDEEWRKSRVYSHGCRNA